MFGVETWTGRRLDDLRERHPALHVRHQDLLQTGAPSSPCTPVDPIHLLVFVLRFIQLFRVVMPRPLPVRWFLQYCSKWSIAHREVPQSRNLNGDARRCNSVTLSCFIVSSWVLKPAIAAQPNWIMRITLQAQMTCSSTACF